MLPKARSLVQAIAVAKQGEQNETSNTKEAGVRLLNHLTFDLGSPSK
jgi:hypothetical protein